MEIRLVCIQEPNGLPWWYIMRVEGVELYLRVEQIAKYRIGDLEGTGGEIAVWCKRVLATRYVSMIEAEEAANRLGMEVVK